MTRTFIYGSCVSRDTVEFFPKQDTTIVGYIARQSLLSAFSPLPLENRPEPRSTSHFQQRMLDGDWSGSLPSTLKSLSTSIDLLLWDLCDERLGVRQLQPSPPWAFTTRSVDSIRTGWDDALSTKPLWALGEQGHKEQFRVRVQQFAALLDVLHLRDKIVLVRPAWAETTSKGEKTPKSFHLTASEANRLFTDYYSIIQDEASIPTVTAPSDITKADEDHRWGVAPFHYTPDVYARLTEEIESLAQYRNGSCA